MPDMAGLPRPRPGQRVTLTNINKNVVSRCEVLTWPEKFEESRVIEPRILDGPKALHDELEKIYSGKQTSTPGTLNDKAATNTSALESRRNPVIIVHGLAHDVVTVLLNTPLNIDPSFIEAHAGRRGYRPLRRGNTTNNRSSFTNLTYPELIETDAWSKDLSFFSDAFYSWSAEKEGDSRPTVDSLKVDLLDGPFLNYLSDDISSDRGIALCRVSLWAADCVDIVFLDRQVWEDPVIPVRKAKATNRAVTKPFKLLEHKPIVAIGIKSTWDIIFDNGEELPSLKTMFIDALHGCTDTSTLGDCTSLDNTLTEKVYDHWLLLLESLPPDFSWAEACAVRLLQSAECNESVVGQVYRCRHTSEHHELEARPFDLESWRNLTKRLQSRVLLSGKYGNDSEKMSSGDSAHRSSSTGSRSTGTKKSRRNVRAHRQLTKEVITADVTGHLPADHTSQQALDRVTYLGAVLLPVSIVSGILSMNESFQPGAPLFWVFWSVAVPLIGFTVLVILVDKERVTEVWTSAPTSLTALGSEEADHRVSLTVPPGGESKHIPSGPVEDNEDHVIQIGGEEGKRHSHTPYCVGKVA